MQGNKWLKCQSKIKKQQLHMVTLLHTIKSSLIRKFQRIINKFFDFPMLPDTTFKQTSDFFETKRKNEQLAFNQVLKFLEHHLDKINHKEITKATMRI